ncbi:caspase domain-containing protein [Mycena leptocephala]|nr:caspase domain-containing protein [Mycena leptocephala]
MSPVTQLSFRTSNLLVFCAILYPHSYTSKQFMEHSTTSSSAADPEGMAIEMKEIVSSRSLRYNCLSFAEIVKLIIQNALKRRSKGVGCLWPFKTPFNILAHAYRTQYKERQGPKDIDYHPGREIDDIDSSTVFALIIGINDYIADSFPRLKGCVNDAESFRQFLLDPREKHGLGVPSNNIILLKNEQATRAAILDKFKTHFTTNENIPPNGKATMIFFFAGHGSRADAPGNMMASDEKVETICPHDERTYTRTNEYVHGIPDYILGWLLHELSQKKGKNITIIFDSCHSGGMGREPDRNLWEGTTDAYTLWSQSAQSPILHSAPSHVLLAACREDESAREDESLIDSLRCTDPPLKYTTYDELLKRMQKWPTQNPHCGGTYSNRLVFTRKYPATGERSMLLTMQDSASPSHSDPTISITMGSIHGVVNGTVFSVHAPDNTDVCVLVAKTVRIHESILAFSEDTEPVQIPKGSRARVVAWNNEEMILRVFLSPGFVRASVMFPESKVTDRGPLHKYVQVQSAEEADTVLRWADTTKEVFIKRTIMAGEYETRVSLNGKPEHLANIADAIAHFNYFLKCQSPNGKDPKVVGLFQFTLEMHRLVGEWPQRKPDLNIGNMVKTVSGRHEVRFRSEKDAEYGFIITNNSDFDLYPYLFYFNPVKCTIKEIYLPDGSNSMKPLKGKNTLNVGMGGSDPFEFELPPKATSSSGLLKLFVSTQYLDLSGIEQTISPFDQDFQGVERLEMRRPKPAFMSHWDVCCVELTLTDT